MILYNVTTKVDNEIHDEWLKWMQEVHIPDVLKTGMFVEGKICRIITNKEPDGTSYAVQYLCNNMATFHKYEVQYSKALREDYAAKFAGKYVVYRSMMEVLSNHQI